MDKSMRILIMVEVVVLGAIALIILGFLADQYDRASIVLANRTALAQQTEVYIAILTALPPNAPANAGAISASPTRTITLSVSSTIVPTNTLPSTSLVSRTLTLSLTPGPSTTPRVSGTPAPPTPTRPTNTPRPTQAASLTSSSVSKCGSLDDSGNYKLTADLSSSGDCITVQTSYAILDCQGHTIRGANFQGYGIAVRKYGLLNGSTPAYVEIKNCNVSGYRYGIWVEAGKNLVVHDNNVSNNYDDTDSSRYGIFLGMVEGGGIRFNATTDSFILANTTTTQAIGIDVRTSSNIKVQGNISSNNSAWGINLIRTQASEVSSNQTADNVRKCTWGAGTVGFGCDAGGIAIQDGSNGVLIANNTVTGRNGNGIFIKAHAMPCGNNNTITGNNISNVLYNAVELGFCTGNKVNNNNIRGGLDGVWMGFSQNTEIKNNFVTGMSNHGIISGNSHNNIISGNNVVNSNEGLYFFTDDYDRVAFGFLQPGDYKSHDNCLCSNTLQSNSVAVHLKDSTNNQISSNIFQSNQRTILMQGNSGGNQIQNNTGWVPFPFEWLLARTQSR